MYIKSFLFTENESKGNPPLGAEYFSEVLCNIDVEEQCFCMKTLIQIVVHNRIGYQSARIRLSVHRMLTSIVARQ